MNSVWLYQTTEKAIVRKEKHLDEEEADEDEEVIYKIEVPANRYHYDDIFDYFFFCMWELRKCFNYVHIFVLLILFLTLMV